MRTKSKTLIICWTLLSAGWLGSGCDDADVAFASCTNFLGDNAVGGTVNGTTTTTGQPRGCHGTVVVIVHDAPAPALEAFTVGMLRVELLSQGRVFVLFDGDRRENLLEFRDRGFLLARKDDVPEVEFDAVRLELSDADIVAGTERRTLPFENDGRVVVPLDPPLSVISGSPERLRIDIDAAATFAPAAATLEDLPLVPPVVRAQAGDPDEVGLPLGPTSGTVLKVDRARGRFLLDVEGGAGQFWTALPPTSSPGTGGGPQEALGLAAGDPIIIEGSLEGDITLQPAVLVPTASSDF